MREDRLESGNQTGPGGTQLSAMRDGKSLEQLFASARDAEIHSAGVIPAAGAANPPVRLQAMAELDGGVMTDLQPLRKRTDRSLEFRRAAGDREKRLMLLRLDARCVRRSFAEIQEAANFVAKVRERFVIDFGLRIRLHDRDYIVIRYKMHCRRFIAGYELGTAWKVRQ